MFEIIGIDFFFNFSFSEGISLGYRLLNIYNVVLNLYSTDKGF